MEEHKHDSVTIRKNSIWKFTTFMFAALLVISLVTGGFGINSGTGTGNTNVGAPAAVANNAPSAIPTGIVAVNAAEIADDDPYLGDENAPLTIVEFSDYQCPFCKRFRDETLPQIKAEYIDTGKVKFVYRDFPLENIHPQARPAAEAAECAGEQGKYWEYHDILFENMQLLSSANYKIWAETLGLNTNQFNDCVDSRKYADEVTADLNDGAKVGARGTPYFIVGNTPLSGAQPYSAFKATIESELSKL